MKAKRMVKLSTEKRATIVTWLRGEGVGTARVAGRSLCIGKLRLEARRVTATSSLRS